MRPADYSEKPDERAPSLTARQPLDYSFRKLGWNCTGITPTGTRISLDSEQFWKTFRACSNKLPPTGAAVFHLQEVDEGDNGEICTLL